MTATDPTKTLPATHTLAWAVDMKKDTRLNWTLQIAGLFWFVLVGWALWKIVPILRPDYAVTGQFTVSIWLLVYALLVIFVVLILHELVHGLFFWLFTSERPVFGMGPGYAYAAAPDWYFPKGRYLVVGLSPLVLLSVVGLAIVPTVPVAWLWVVLLAIIFNAGGAVGDLYICLRIMGEADDVWVRDSGDGFEIYRQRVE